MDGLAIQLIIMVIFGIITAAVASSKGRTPVGWFFCGFFISWIGLIIICCMSNIKEQQAYRDRQSRENRRLRESLRQERLKGESFRQHTATRLDAHDNQLGVDTRSVAALPGQMQQPAMLEAAPSPLDQLGATAEPGAYDTSTTNDQYSGFNSPQTSAGADSSARSAPLPVPGMTAATPTPNPAGGTARQWHYELNGQVTGPIGENQLVAMLKANQLDGSTLLWTEDLGDWKAANQIRALKQFVPA